MEIAKKLGLWIFSHNQHPQGQSESGSYKYLTSDLAQRENRPRGAFEVNSAVKSLIDWHFLCIPGYL